MIIRIGRMISYQEYNTKSPLNGLAAKWAAQNRHLLPIDARAIAPPFAERDLNQKVSRGASAIVPIEMPTSPVQSDPSRKEGDPRGGEDSHRNPKRIEQVKRAHP